jgi:hypothetical protein
MLQPQNTLIFLGKQTPLHHNKTVTIWIKRANLTQPKANKVIKLTEDSFRADMQPNPSNHVVPSGADVIGSGTCRSLKLKEDRVAALGCCDGVGEIGRCPLSPIGKSKNTTKLIYEWQCNLISISSQDTVLEHYTIYLALYLNDLPHSERGEL